MGLNFRLLGGKSLQLMTTQANRLKGSPRAFLSQRRLPLSSQVVPSLMVLLDSVAIVTSGLVTHVIIVGAYGNTIGYYAVAISFVWLTTVLLMNFAGLYKFDVLLRPIVYLDKFVVAFLTTILFLLAAAFALKIFRHLLADLGHRLRRHRLRHHNNGATINLIRASQTGACAHITREVVLAGEGNQIGQVLDYMASRKPPFVSIRGVFVDERTGDAVTTRALRCARHP